MPQATHSVKVEAIPDEPMRFRVESWSSSEFPYTVDLLEQGGNGECTCKDFRTHCLPNLQFLTGQGVDRFVCYGSAGHPDPERTQCKHIYCARTKFLNDLLRDMAKGQKEKV